MSLRLSDVGREATAGQWGAGAPPWARLLPPPPLRFPGTPRPFRWGPLCLGVSLARAYSRHPACCTSPRPRAPPSVSRGLDLVGVRSRVLPWCLFLSLDESGLRVGSSAFPLVSEYFVPPCYVDGCFVSPPLGASWEERSRDLGSGRAGFGSAPPLIGAVCVLDKSVNPL